MSARLNITGRRFGRLTVLRRSGGGCGRRGGWLCRCDCGNETTVRTDHLASKNTSSCGCGQLSPRHGHGGQNKSPTYRSWMKERCRKTKNSGKGAAGCERWIKSFPAFLADMGERPPGGNLSKIDRKGTYERGNCRWTSPERQADRPKRKTAPKKVPRKGSRTYNSWLGMKQRCLNSNNNSFKNYGGRGIAICDRWLNSFLAFLEDEGEAPPGLSLDRIDNDGNYEPGNCRWATPKQQRNNRRALSRGQKLQRVSAWRPSDRNPRGWEAEEWKQKNGSK